jgi:ABC-2 type transport system ATP-binding protein
MVAGLLRPDGGDIAIFGAECGTEPSRAKQTMAWLPDEPMLYDKLTALVYLDFVAGLWGVEPDGARGPGRGAAALAGLWDARNQRCESFSRGMKQKAGARRSAHHEPRLLILDEPLTGLDAAAARTSRTCCRRGCAPAPR